jgi:PAS domain S-box-containing protein
MAIGGSLLGQTEDRLFRMIVEGTREYAIFLLDSQGLVATWNAGAERIKGYKAQEVIGRHFRLFYVQADIEDGKPEHALALALKEGRFEEDALRIRKDGTQFWSRVVITALRDDNGVPIGFAKFTRDIAGQQRGADLFRLALEAAPTGMIMVNPKGSIVLVNTQVERLFGYNRAELVGRQMEMLVPERFRARHPGFRKGFFEDPKARPMGAGRDLFGRRKDGTEVPVEIGLTPLQTPDGDFVLSSVVDISQSKHAEEERERLLDQLRLTNVDLTATLKERGVLLQEIHHRVKNNLQVISSMINMQVRRMVNGASREALRECQNRVQAIALIHEKLYESDDYSRIPFADYARSLAKNIFDAARLVSGTVSLDLAFEDVALTVDKAIPTGLILNELLSNALKHAFPEGRRGILRVELGRTQDGYVTLLVRDDGVGLPAGFDIRKSKSLGLQIVSTLAEQLKAVLGVAGEPGTLFRVTFHDGTA